MRKQEVLEELAHILESDAFRGSRKCCRFLDFSVRHTLEGNAREGLRERIIGVEVFDRAPSYDASEDAIVRVTANEVRKRLAQYYGGTDVESNLVISLPPGSYAATFTSKQPVPELGQTAPQQRSHRWRSQMLALAILLPVLVSVLVIVFLWASGRDGVENGVWSTMLGDSRPVLICVAHPVAFEFTGVPTWNLATEGEGGPLIQPSAALGQIVRMRDVFVGVGDAHALADIVSFLARRGKLWHLNAGDATPSAELRDGPVVLIGAYENPWTRKMTEGLPFVFEVGSVIRDQTQPGREWRLTNLSPDWHTPEDFAVVSRFFSPDTNQPVIVAAGLSIYGTQAAGEFLTSPSLLSAAVRDAPKDWQKKNFQFVLHTKVLGKTPGTPTVVAKHFW
jgi:hypothetical protein